MIHQATVIGPGWLDLTEGFRGKWVIQIREREPELLRFPTETLSMVTPFRKRVINFIFLTARGLSGGALDSVKVSLSSISDQDDTFALDLTLTVNADWTFIQELRRDVLVSVSEWSKDWSEEQRQDYGRHIFFGILPREL